jgi:hypothetical protein
MDSLLNYLPTATPDERRQLELLISDTFGDLREQIANGETRT